MGIQAFIASNLDIGVRLPAGGDGVCDPSGCIGALCVTA